MQEIVQYNNYVIRARTANTVLQSTIRLCQQYMDGDIHMDSEDFISTYEITRTVHRLQFEADLVRRSTIGFFTWDAEDVPWSSDSRSDELNLLSFQLDEGLLILNEIVRDIRLQRWL